jgi:trigger factor
LIESDIGRIQMMEIRVEVENLSPVKKKIEVEIGAETAQEELDRVAREFAKQARLPGFRSGKAPIGLVKRHFQDEIRGEVLNKLIPESYGLALKEKSLEPLGQPSLDGVHFEKGEPLSYTAEFEILPEFKLPKYKGLKAELEAVKVVKKDIDAELDQLREQQSVLEPVENRPIRDGDYAVIDLNGEPAEAAEGEEENKAEPIRDENVVVHVGVETTHESFNKALLGMNIAESKEIRIDYAADYPDEKLAGQTWQFKIEVTDIKVKVLPELNDDFAKDLGTHESLAGLKKEIKSRLEDHQKEHQDNKLRNSLIDQLVDSVEFEVPEVLAQETVDDQVRRFAQNMISQGVDPMKAEVDWQKFRDDFREGATRQVKSEIILNRIADAEKIKVSKDEREEEIRGMSERMSRPAEQVKQTLIKEGTLDSVLDHIKKRKTVEFLVESAQVKTAGKKGKKKD